MAETEQDRDLRRRDEPRPEGASSDDEFETVVRRKRQSNANSHKKPYRNNDGINKDYGHGPANKDYGHGPANKDYGHGPTHLHNGGGGGRGRGRDREVCDRDRDWRERDRERDRDFRSNSRNNRNFRRNHFRESNPNQMPNTSNTVRNKNSKIDAQLNVPLTQGGSLDNVNQEVKDVPSCNSLNNERSSGENGAASPGAGDKSEESCGESIVNQEVDQVVLDSDQKGEKEKEKQTEIIITPAPPPQVNPWRVNKLVNSTTDQNKDKQGKGSLEDKQIQPDEVIMTPLTPIPVSSPQRGNSRRSKNRASSGHSQHSQSQQEEKLDKPAEIEIQQPIEVVTEIIITPAPPPQVNPWLVNRNAASVILKTGTDSCPKSTPASTPIAQQTVLDGKMPNKTTDVPRRFATTKAAATAAKTQKTISASQVIIPATNNANQTATANSTSTSSMNEQAKVVSHNDSGVAGEDTTDGCLPVQRKDIQLQQPPQGPKFRRGFAAVTKYHSKIGSNSPLSSTRNSPEDWPSLQIIATTVVTNAQDSLAETKPVITLPRILLEVEGKMTGANSGESSAAATTPSSDTFEDISDHKESCSLPSDNWPSVVSISHHTIQSIRNKESSLESGWNSGGSDLTNEDTPSEASTGEIRSHNKDSLPEDENSRNHSENGSLGSSDDQGLVDNELEADASSSGGSKKGKKPKQKWVKLDLPETPSHKTRPPQERQNMEKERNGGDKAEIIGTNNKAVGALALQNQNEFKKSKIKLISNNDNNDVVVNAKLSNGPTNDARINYLPRGRGRAANNGIRGRGGRGRFGTSQYWGYSRENSSPSSEIITTSHVNGEEFCQDLPTDYTTLPPCYPMTEFVMPYSTAPYYATRAPNYTPPQATVDDAQLVSGYVPVEATVLLDMVKKQIEYYFSEGNLEKDFYLRRKMNQEGFLPLSFIATFPRVKIMTQDPTVVIQAIQASPELELTEDFIFVRTRNTPEKWPLTNDHPSQDGIIITDMTPVFPPQNGPTPCINNATNTNGYDLLSGDDTYSKSNPILSPTGTNLNPNVAEFVPKSNINISLTV